MEIHYTEIESQNPYEKYWVQKEEELPKKKRVSFNDILSNMNLVVNKAGVLQRMTIAKKDLNEDFYEDLEKDFNQQNQYQQNQYQQNQKPQYYSNEANPQQPLHPAVKNSFLYNKYFKDYNDKVSVEPQERVPKTMEEYRQMLLDDQKKRYEERKRIAQIKSTKLMFTTNPAYPVASVKNIQPTKNTLRKMTFM